MFVNVIGQYTAEAMRQIAFISEYLMNPQTLHESVGISALRLPRRRPLLSRCSLRSRRWRRHRRRRRAGRSLWRSRCACPARAISTLLLLHVHVQQVRVLGENSVLVDVLDVLPKGLERRRREVDVGDLLLCVTHGQHQRREIPRARDPAPRVVEYPHVLIRLLVVEREQLCSKARAAVQLDGVRPLGQSLPTYVGAVLPRLAAVSRDNADNLTVVHIPVPGSTHDDGAQNVGDGLTEVLLRVDGAHSLGIVAVFAVVHTVIRQWLTKSAAEIGVENSILHSTIVFQVGFRYA